MALASSSPSNNFFHPSHSLGCRFRPITASLLCPPHRIEKSSLVIAETASEEQLRAAACLRVRSFNHFKPTTYDIQEHRRYLAEREFEALKERVAGQRTGFRRVSCVNATLPLSHLASSSLADLCSLCKFTEDGEDHVVVGTLDINQCVSLPDEIIGMKPEGIAADFARGYLSNVCVAEELHRNGLAHELIAKAKIVAEEWGITDLYVHVAVSNEPATKLYTKSGFIYEKDEPAWQARYLNRPRRLLLWIGLPMLIPSLITESLF